MYNAVPVRRVSIEGIGRHNIAGLEQAREGIVVHKHGATEAATNASQVLHIVLHVRAHRLRPAHITPSHAAILEREIRPCMCAHRQIASIHGMRTEKKIQNLTPHGSFIYTRWW